MIHLFGAIGTREHQAALALQTRILESWPEIKKDHKNRVTIVAGAQCHGQQVRDLDLVVLGTFKTGLAHKPLFPFEFHGTQKLPEEVIVDSLCVTIEVKDHHSDGVKFVGTTVKVAYGNKWHDATNQNERQMYSFLNYLRANHITPPYITPLIWLRNVPNTSLPPRPHNIFGGNATWEMLLSTVIQMARPRPIGDRWHLSAHDLGHKGIHSIAELLTRKLKPSEIDRHRMEQINEHIILRKQNLPEVVGTRLLVLRGRGGTGKTIRLLQLAKHFYEIESARVLVLTYNKALVADLRRLLTIMGIADYTARSSIQIQTVHSYFYSLMVSMGLIEAGAGDFIKHYDEHQNELRKMLKVGAITREDIDELKSADWLTFYWDYIFVDEGQDWPQDERDILFALYSHRDFVVADGIDQLIRSNQPADWRGELPRSQMTVKPLKRCLRMKAGLTRFVAAFAEQMGLSQLEWVANEEVPGGRVIVLEGTEWSTNQAFFETLTEENREAGNEPIDMLFCVPPNMVIHTDEDDAISLPGQLFQQWGWPVWEGTSPIVRETYPTHLQQRRVVQYDSCRGLEGWAVVNFALDDFYDYKLQRSYTTLQQDEKHIGYNQARAQIYAARWLMIPLTRAMDTLVIHVRQKNSKVREALLTVLSQYPEFVEWLNYPQSE
jgi:hypothetical protein